MDTCKSVRYQCPNCGQERGLQSRILGSGDIHACTACGLTLEEGSFRMQEELANMFSQNMNLSNHVPEPEPSPTVNYSISQHYHHSTHVAANLSVVEDGQSVHSPPKIAPDTKAILEQQDIDTTHLLTPQLRLFEQALPEQRDRLIELWRIAPPDKAQPGGLGGWQDTTFAQEEEEARVRYERRISGTGTSPSHEDIDMQESRLGNNEAVEPYMKSGYEILAERDYNRQANRLHPLKESYSPLGSAVGYAHALDPAFSGKEWWRDFMGQQPMEFQYGMLDQMNQFRPMEENGQEDDEMS